MSLYQSDHRVANVCRGGAFPRSFLWQPLHSLPVCGTTVDILEVSLQGQATEDSGDLDALQFSNAEYYQRNPLSPYQQT